MAFRRSTSTSQVTRRLYANDVIGSIPESADGKLYNTATVYSPKGELIATHRKVHLFDIDIPGQITFKVCLLIESMVSRF